MSENERSARLAVKLGPVRARFAGKVLLRDVLPAERCTLVFEGSGGAAGFARGESVVTLQAEGDGTQVAYTVNASVGGKLGQVGGRMIDSAARGMADEFFAALAREWLPVETAPEPTPAAPSPASAARPQASDSDTPARPFEPASLEALRIKWFVLGAAATGFGVALAHWLG